MLRRFFLASGLVRISINLNSALGDTLGSNRPNISAACSACFGSYFITNCQGIEQSEFLLDRTQTNSALGHPMSPPVAKHATMPSQVALRATQSVVPRPRDENPCNPWTKSRRLFDYGKFRCALIRASTSRKRPLMKARIPIGSMIMQKRVRISSRMGFNAALPSALPVRK